MKLSLSHLYLVVTLYVIGQWFGSLEAKFHIDTPLGQIELIRHSQNPNDSPQPTWPLPVLPPSKRRAKDKGK